MGLTPICKPAKAQLVADVSGAIGVKVPIIGSETTTLARGGTLHADGDRDQRPKWSWSRRGRSFGSHSPG